MVDNSSQAEPEIAQALAANDLNRAALLTLQAYGSEILGFLMADMRSDQFAEEVFSIFNEDLWRSLPGLTLRTTMRAYAYALARNARNRYLARDVKKQRRGIPLSQAQAAQGLIHATRTQTQTFQQTAAQQRVADLRKRLSEDERTLLTLRLDRRLDWREIAEVVDGDDADLARSAARLRKRFQLTKDKLTRWAREEGLLRPKPTE